MSNDNGTITLDINAYMDRRLEVYGADSARIGTIDDFDGLAGYMFVRPTPLSGAVLYIPFSAITHIDPREVFISGAGEEAHREYASPPPRQTFVEQRTDPITGEDDSRAITLEPSGYDGTPVVVDQAEIGQLAHHIAPGFHVYSSEHEDLGRIQEYDREAGQIVVKRHIFSQDTMAIPVTLVGSVDRDDRTVSLAVSAADLERHPPVGAWNEASEELVVEAQGTLITETIADTIALGQSVYDSEGERVGNVDDLDRPTGYMTVQTNPFSGQDLFIPFRLITNIDPRELYLSLSKDELHRDYADPPRRTTRVEEAAGEEVAITTEPSGYDGTPIVVERARIDQLRTRIATGDHVYTTDLTDLGTVTQYDPATGWMTIEKGALSTKRDLTVPLAVVRDVNRETHEVYLAVSRADVERIEPV